MKRNREPGDSPAPKNLLHDNASQDSNYQGYRLLMFDSDDDFNFRSDGAPSSSSSSQQTYFNDPSSTLRSALDSFLATSEPSLAATLVMQYDDIKHEILKMLYSNVHNQFKTSLKKSKLITTKKDRKYLLKLNPTDLCQEFNDNANLAFQFVTKGLLGLTNEQAIFESQFLLNKICLLFSILAQSVNKKATAYALLLTTAVRHGGLREDSLKLLACLVHPRTSQKYDKSVLARNWDKPLNDALKKEKDHFQLVKEAEIDLKESICDNSSEDTICLKKSKLEALLDETPPQLQLVWDNMNLLSKHRFERMDDKPTDLRVDWMASLWIKDRIDANHMQHRDEESLMDICDLRKGFN